MTDIFIQSIQAGTLGEISLALVGLGSLSIVFICIVTNGFGNLN